MGKKGKRQWGATGADFSAYAIPMLSADARKQIEQFLKGHSIKVSDPDGFFGALASAIGFFHVNLRLREKSLPGTVRENLERAVDRASALNDALKKLDGNSCQLLGEVVQDGIFSINDNVRMVLLALNRAQSLADDYPSAGNFPELHRQFLAADVKDAIETFLVDIKVTTTKKGLFVEILEEVLKEATGKEATAVHELARMAVKHKVKRRGPDGLIEYVPPLKKVNRG